MKVKFNSSMGAKLKNLSASIIKYQKRQDLR
jgi:hypothetical protein